MPPRAVRFRLPKVETDKPISSIIIFIIMNSQKNNQQSQQVYLRVGDTEIKAPTVEEARALAEISQIVPKKHTVKYGTTSSTGYGDEGEKKAAMLVFGIGGGILGGIFAYKNREKIKNFIRVIRGLPSKADMANPNVVDTEFEVVPDRGQQEPQMEEWTQKTDSKFQIEQFLEEFGPMPELPPMLQFVVERSPAGYEVAMTATLLCAFAALCFSKVRAKYLDGKVHAPNLLVLVESNWGVGKDKFMTALNALFKRLIDRDKEKYSSSDEGKIIQWAGISATESKFIDILANNGEVHVLMVSSEVLTAVNNMRKQNGLTAEYYRKAFDNGEVFRANKSKDIQGVFRVFMNCILTGTQGDTTKFFSKELEGGTASRFCLLAIPDSGRYLEALIIEDGEELERYRDQIDEWNRTYCYDHDESSGCDIPADEHFIDLGYVNDSIKSWIDDQWIRTNGDTSDPRRDARGRMGAIAFHFAMVIHMLFGCPGPDMLQTRRKVVDLTIYLANYCMERFLHKFGDIQRVQRELNNQAERVENTTTVDKEAQQSSPQPDEKNYSGGLSKSTVKKMFEMYIPGKVGSGTIAKYFGLSGESGQKKVKRAIKKYKQELGQK